MATKKILVQLDIQAASNLTSPLSGFVGFSAKADGLYQKIGTAPELRLLTSADVQNAILADGSITGAVSQAQIFTMGVKLYNLTQGYIPYALGATKLLNNSPIYTDGTSVGIGTTNPGAPLDVIGNIRNSGGDFITTSDNIRLLDSTSAVAFRSVRANAWTDLKDTRFFQIGNINDNVAFTSLNGVVANRMMFSSSSTQITTRNYQSNAPTGIFEVSNGTSGLFNILSSGNVGIGTISPTASLHIKAGTATGNTAPIKLTSGVNLTTPESGAIEFSSSRLYFTPSSTRETIAFLSLINFSFIVFTK